MVVIQCPYLECNFETIDAADALACSNMVVVQYPYPEGNFETIDAADALSATLLQIHASGTHSNTTPARTHLTANTAATARVEKVRRPTVTTGGTSEEWSYFNVRWQDYVTATKTSGRDLVIQFLECCDEDLQKYF